MNRRTSLFVITQLDYAPVLRELNSTTGSDSPTRKNSSASSIKVYTKTFIDSPFLSFFQGNNYTDAKIAYELAKRRRKIRLSETAGHHGNDAHLNAIATLIIQQQQQNTTDRDDFGPDNLQQLRHIVQLLNLDISSIIMANTTIFRTLVQYSVSSRYVINLVRVPKAGSSALSMIGRALAGCKPDGFACCEKGRIVKGKPFLKNPKACPRIDIHCDVLQGCSNHKATYNITVVSRMPVEPTISQLRDPFDRSLSFFFNGVGGHRAPDLCSNLDTDCFRTFIRIEKYQNILAKMLIGDSAYAPRLSQSINETIQSAKYRLCHQLSWFGLIDMPIASQLLLYESEPFSWLQPNPVVFNLHVLESETQNKTMYSNMFRNNTKKSYLDAKQTWRETTELQKLFKSLNQPDYELYDFTVQLFCARVESSGLLSLSKYFDRNPFDKCEQHYLNTENESYSGSQVEELLCSLND